MTPCGAVFQAFLDVQEAEIMRLKHEEKPTDDPEPYYRIPETITVGSGTVWFGAAYVYRALTDAERKHARNVAILQKQAGR